MFVVKLLWFEVEHLVLTYQSLLLTYDVKNAMSKPTWEVDSPIVDDQR